MKTEVDAVMCMTVKGKEVELTDHVVYAGNTAKEALDKFAVDAEDGLESADKMGVSRKLAFFRVTVKEV